VVPIDRTTARKKRGADTTGEQRLASARSAELTVENDLLWTDRAYTNGIRLQLHEYMGLYGIIPFLGVNVPHCARTVVHDSTTAIRCIRTSAAVQQTMYTPANQYADTVQPADRPFAGLLYGSGRWELVRRTFFDLGQRATWRDGDLIIGLEGQAGVIGPTAGARETQRMAHWALATTAARPNGWHFQTSGRPYVQALADVWYRPSATTGAVLRDSCTTSTLCGLLTPLDGADVALHAGMAIGSVFHRASVGLSGRWANSRQRLPGSPLFRAISPTVQYRLSEADTLQKPIARGGPHDADEEPRASHRHAPAAASITPPRLRYALTATVVLRAHARNETITGGHTFPERPAPRERFEAGDLRLKSGYAEAAFGGEIEVDRVRFGFQSIWRGSEFSRRSNDVAAPGNRYFTLSVAYRPR
jgi:hypothetical protein